MCCHETHTCLSAFPRKPKRVCFTTDMACQIPQLPQRPYGIDLSRVYHYVMVAILLPFSCSLKALYWRMQATSRMSSLFEGSSITFGVFQLNSRNLAKASWPMQDCTHDQCYKWAAC